MAKGEEKERERRSAPATGCCAAIGAYRFRPFSLLVSSQPRAFLCCSQVIVNAQTTYVFSIGASLAIIFCRLSALFPTESSPSFRLSALGSTIARNGRLGILILY